MLGFGMSERDKWHLGQAEVLLAPIAELMGQDVKPMARQMFDSVKAELSVQYGESMYSEDIGDKLIANNKDIVAKRLAAGLTLEDFRNYWNQTKLMGFLASKVLELGEYIQFQMAQQTVKDEAGMIQVVRGWRKTEPRYGDPEKWNPASPVNEGYSAQDADIYIEFMTRVGIWREKTSQSEVDALLENYSSYNAMLRDLIRNGKI